MDLVVSRICTQRLIHKRTAENKTTSDCLFSAECNHKVAFIETFV